MEGFSNQIPLVIWICILLAQVLVVSYILHFYLRGLGGLGTTLGM